VAISIRLRLTSLVSIGWLGFGHLAAQSARDVARRSFSSVVLITTQDVNRQPLALGSGFFVADGVVATNLHVIGGAGSATARVVGQERTLHVTGIVGMDTLRDLALLRIEGASGQPLVLGDSRAASVGDVVYVVGNPEGLEGTFSQGIVSGIRRISSDTLLQITAPISPGSSGGPVLDAHGDVIGVAVASFKEGQNLNFAVPTAYVVSLMRRVGPPQPLTVARRRVGRSRAGASPAGTGVSGTLFRWDPYQRAPASRMAVTLSQCEIALTTRLPTLEQCSCSMTAPGHLSR